MNKALPDNGIITVAEVQWIKAQCTDKEMLLMWALGFRYCAIFPQMERMQTEHFYFRNGLPTGFRIPGPAGAGPEAEWYVPIRPEDQELIGVLIPAHGRIFSTSHPFRRLTERGAEGRIWLTQNRIRQTSAVYALASGAYHKEMLALGQFGPQLFTPHSLAPVSQAEARKYWLVTESPENAAKLPRYAARARVTIL